MFYYAGYGVSSIDSELNDNILLAHKRQGVMMTEELLTTKEIVAETGLELRTVQRWISDGRLESRKIGRDYVVTRSVLDEFLAHPPASLWAMKRAKKL